jgi:hypothetical protein
VTIRGGRGHGLNYRVHIVEIKVVIGSNHLNRRQFRRDRHFNVEARVLHRSGPTHLVSSRAISPKYATP